MVITCSPWTRRSRCWVVYSCTKRISTRADLCICCATLVGGVTIVWIWNEEKGPGHIINTIMFVEQSKINPAPCQSHLAKHAKHHYKKHPDIIHKSWWHHAKPFPPQYSPLTRLWVCRGWLLDPSLSGSPSPSWHQECGLCYMLLFWMATLISSSCQFP